MEPPLPKAVALAEPKWSEGHKTAVWWVHACGLQGIGKNIKWKEREVFMNGLFEKIYDEVICYEKDVTAMNQAIEKKNNELSLKYQDRLDEKEREGLVDILDDIAVSAGKEGFYMGFCYAFRGMLALLKE